MNKNTPWTDETYGKPKFKKTSFGGAINTPQSATSLCLISRILKKLIVTIFASVFITFMEKKIFGGLYSIIPALSILTWFLKCSWVIYI